MIIIANSNPIHSEMCQSILNEFPDSRLLTQKEELTVDLLTELKPDYIFFPHWSFIIPKSIYQQFNCVVFHMTDLPFGRGGSPLQNLIDRGVNLTKISALKVSEGIDTGDIYLKEDLYLYGTAEEIFLRTGSIIKKMIYQIIATKPDPIPQTGEIITFKRRTPSQSDISTINSIEKIYDFIRMLDAEGYPKAYIESEHFRFEFSRASLKKDCIISDVRIIKK